MIRPRTHKFPDDDETDAGDTGGTTRRPNRVTYTRMLVSGDGAAASDPYAPL